MEAVQLTNKLRTQSLTDEKARRREADEAREELLTHAGLNKRGNTLVEARRAWEKTSEAVNRWQTLKVLTDNQVELANELEELTILSNSQEELDAALTIADQAVNRVVELAALVNQHCALTVTHDQLVTDLVTLDKTVTVLQKELTELIGTTCPYCGQGIKHQC
jgi:hypothetical protein